MPSARRAARRWRALDSSIRPVRVLADCLLTTGAELVRRDRDLAVATDDDQDSLIAYDAAAHVGAANAFGRDGSAHAEEV